jgi:hypothetical protein
MSVPLVPSHTSLNGLPPSWPASNQQHYTFISSHLFHVWCLFYTHDPLSEGTAFILNIETTHLTAHHHVQEVLSTQSSCSLLVSKLFCELHGNVWNICNVHCKRWILQNCELLFEDTHTQNCIHVWQFSKIIWQESIVLFLLSVLAWNLYSLCACVGHWCHVNQNMLFQCS